MKGKTKLGDRVRVYHKQKRQPQYHQLKVKWHLRVCGNGEFWVFSLIQIRSQNKNLMECYKTRFHQKFK